MFFRELSIRKRTRSCKVRARTRASKITQPAYVADVVFEDHKSAQGSRKVRARFAQGRVPLVAGGPLGTLGWPNKGGLGCNGRSSMRQSDSAYELRTEPKAHSLFLWFDFMQNISCHLVQHLGPGLEGLAREIPPDKP